MKQNKHTLDDFLRSSVEEAGFNYQEKYWHTMSAILDEEDRKKKRFFFWRWFSILAVLLITGVSVFFFQHRSPKADAPAAQLQTNATIPNTLPSVKQDATLPAASANHASTSDAASQPTTHSDAGSQSINKSGVQALVTASTSNNSSDKGTQTSVVASSSAVISGQAAKPTSTNTSDKGTQSSVPAVYTAKQSSKTAAKSKETATPTPALNQSIANSTQPKIAESSDDYHSRASHRNRRHRNANPSSSAQTAVAQANTASSSKNQPNHTQSTTTASNQYDHQSATQTAYTVNSSTAQTVSVQGKPMNAVDTTQYVRRRAVDQSIYNPRYIGSLANYIPEHLDSITIITYKEAPVATTSSTTQTTPVAASASTVADNAVKNKSLHWAILAGLNINKGFQGNVSSPVSWAGAPYAGVGFDRNLSNKFMFCANIGFTYFNGLNTERSVSSYQYSFGIDSSIFTVNHKKLMELNLPLSLYYQIMQRHYLMLSIGATYAFDVSSRVSQTSMSNNTGTTSVGTKTPTTVSTTQSGYRTGYNQGDVFMQVGYSYRVFQGVMLQCILQQGFLDMTRNQYFNNSVRNTQTRISVGIHYQFKHH